MLNVIKMGNLLIHFLSSGLKQHKAGNPLCRHRQAKPSKSAKINVRTMREIVFKII